MRRVGGGMANLDKETHSLTENHLKVPSESLHPQPDATLDGNFHQPTKCMQIHLTFSQSHKFYRKCYNQIAFTRRTFAKANYQQSVQSISNYRFKWKQPNFFPFFLFFFFSKKNRNWLCVPKTMITELAGWGRWSDYGCVCVCVSECACEWLWRSINSTTTGNPSCGCLSKWFAVAKTSTTFISPKLSIFENNKNYFWFWLWFSLGSPKSYMQIANYS